MIGARLKEERTRLGLTQPVFAELAGVKKRAIVDWEKGSSSPTALQLQAFASKGVDVQYIITGSPNEYAYIGNGLIDSDAFTLPFRKDWLAAKGLELKNLTLTTPKDDGMVPFMNAGDNVLLDIKQRKDGTSLVHGLPDGETLVNGIYLVQVASGKRLRRLKVDQHDGMVDILCDNQDYKSQKYTIEEARKLIIGRVVWYSRDIG